MRDLIYNIRIKYIKYLEKKYLVIREYLIIRDNVPACFRKVLKQIERVSSKKCVCQ